MHRLVLVPAIAALTSFLAVHAHGAAALTRLDQFVVAHGYGGAQFLRQENTYRLPIKVNGNIGDLTIDTGASSSVIFRGSLKKFGLTPTETNEPVRGAFGKGTEKFGIVTIRQLAMGNLSLMNVKATTVSGFDAGALYRPYGSSDGLLGLPEMLRYGMVLDLNNHVILAHPGGQMKEISEGIRSILTNEGYTPISLSVVNNHLQVPAVINGTQSRMIVDSGAFFTAIDRDAARKLRIGGYDTGAVARGLGTGGRGIGYAHFPEMKLGDFTIKNVSVTVSALNPEIIQGKQPAAGFLGADYLGPCGAIFDFNSNTLYLRPKKN